MKWFCACIHYVVSARPWFASCRNKILRSFRRRLSWPVGHSRSLFQNKVQTVGPTYPVQLQPQTIFSPPPTRREHPLIPILWVIIFNQMKTLVGKTFPLPTFVRPILTTDALNWQSKQVTGNRDGKKVLFWLGTHNYFVVSSINN